MIDQINVSTKTKPNGETYDRVTLWIKGIPFCADLIGETMLPQLQRIAIEAGLDGVDDWRS